MDSKSSERLKKLSENTQKHVFYFSGNKSDNKYDQWASNVEKIPDKSYYSVDNKQTVIIGESKNYPVFIFDSLDGNDIVIMGKVNHIVMRMCRNVNIFFKSSAIGGSHLIKCSN